MRKRGHGPQTEGAGKALGMAGEWGAVWLAIGLAAAAVDPPRRDRWLRAAAVAPAAIGINFLVKLAVRRPRPRLRRLPPLAGAPSDLSFPSAHATSSVAAATAMGRVAPASRLPLYGLAAAICLTRPYLGMHYPSDVLGGAAVGLVIGRLWPGLGGKGAEDRLIDLVASAATSPEAWSARADERPAAPASQPSGESMSEGDPGRP
jgi:decaprenylphosphoryl-5-phosphoribose phosphatase